MPPQNTPPESSGKKQMNHSHVGLIAVGLVVVIAFAAISFNNKQTQLQQAATLASQEAERAMSKSIPTSTQEVKPLPGVPKMYTPKELAEKGKNIVIKVDPTLTAEKNPGSQSTPGYETSTDFGSPFVWVNPSAPQTLSLITYNGAPAIKANHKLQVVAGKYQDAYIFPWAIQRQLVGGRENPTNPYALNGNISYVNPTISMSPNASVVNINIINNSGQLSWSTPAIKIPSGDVAYFTLEYIHPTAPLYSDTYYSEIGKVFVVPANMGSTGLEVYEWMFQNIGYDMSIMSNKTNSLAVIGEISPYILNWEPNIPTVINNAYPLSFTGLRFGASVTVQVNIYSSGPPTVYTFTKATTVAPNGKKTFSFIPANEGISFSPGNSVSVKASNANGESNIIWFATQ